MRDATLLFHGVMTSPRKKQWNSHHHNKEAHHKRNRIAWSTERRHMDLLNFKLILARLPRNAQ